MHRARVAVFRATSECSTNEHFPFRRCILYTSRLYTWLVVTSVIGLCVRFNVISIACACTESTCTFHTDARVCICTCRNTRGCMLKSACATLLAATRLPHMYIYIHISIYVCLDAECIRVYRSPVSWQHKLRSLGRREKKKKRTRRYVSNYEPGRDWAHWSLPPLTRQFKQGISFFHILFSFLSFLFLFSRKRETLSFDFVRNYVSTSCPLDSLSLSREREKVNFSQIFLYLNNLWNDSRKEKQKKER